MWTCVKLIKCAENVDYNYDEYFNNEEEKTHFNESVSENGIIRKIVSYFVATPIKNVSAVTVDNEENDSIFDDTKAYYDVEQEYEQYLATNFYLPVFEKGLVFFRKILKQLTKFLSFLSNMIHFFS